MLETRQRKPLFRMNLEENCIVRKVLRNIMHYFPSKIHHTQELLDRDKPQRLSFAVSFLNIMNIDLSSNILWSDEAHFYLNETVNTQNCRIWTKTSRADEVDAR
ncbi:hypothetical protein TNCV_3115081 [Trichonephila clavipes]|nr:hypothetical protein TNCV_3115081 [Trichonephila clavipes]